MLESLFNKVADLAEGLQFYYKETPTLVFSFEIFFCEILQNIFGRLLLLILAAFVLKFRSNGQRCSVRKDGLRNFAKLTGKHLC